MDTLLSFQNIGDLMVLFFLQAVLGFDNLLYISIESKRAPVKQQSAVRKWGIIIAIVLRIVLLFVMVKLLSSLTEPWFTLNHPGLIEGSFNFPVIVFLFGGAFLMYTALKEISHLLIVENLEHGIEGRNSKSAFAAVSMIVFMNLIFSFDSILSAVAITEVFPVLALAIITSGLCMFFVADSVSAFLEKNRMYEVLGLFVLLIVGVVLLGEGGHKADLQFFGYHVEAMSKTTFYFSIVVLFIVEMVQSKYQKNLRAKNS